MSKKIAVIVVGSHYAGKSKTITKYLKLLLKITIRTRIFILNGLTGYIFSQSLEEAEEKVDNFIIRCKIYDLIVIACRPENESPSHLVEVRKNLQLVGFTIFEVSIVKTKNNESYYQDKAKTIYKYLA